MNKQLAILSTTVTLLLSAAFLHADDIDIFFNTEDITETEGFQPNVLFIFDTSRSMDDKIDSKPVYDPNVDYGSSDENYIYLHRTNFSWYRNIRIPIADMKCQAVLDKMNNADYPWLITRGAWWYARDKKWQPFSNYDQGDGIVECQDDRGNHGAPGLYTGSYAVEGNRGPYENSNKREIDWSDYGNYLYVSANYHDYLINNSQAPQRKTDIMKEAAIDLVNNFSGLNLGLMRFDGSEGGYVRHHFSDIETDRTEIINSINDLGANGNTPLAETLWEAHRYFAGLSVDYGTNRNRDQAAVSSGKYVSPIGNNEGQECQANYVVYLTDGEPYSDSGRDSQISALSGSSCSHRDGTSSSSRTCLDEMAEYMANYDYNDQLDGVQSVKTYTIGFDIDMELLDTTAKNGKGKYFTAANSTQLRSAFNSILIDILSSSTSFVAPAVSVNAFNSFQNNADVFYALFEPKLSPRWNGNIKKYYIDSNGVITDADNKSAIDVNTGYFDANARSEWSASSDGNNVQSGGAASLMTASRTVFTSTGESTTNVILNSAENIVSASNTALTKSLFGLDESFDDEDFNGLIKWILGEDPEADTAGTPNRFMGDPLHNRPVLITYVGTPDADDPLTSSDLEQELVTTTNDGAFHLINAKTGVTRFTYIPQEMLHNQYAYFNDNPDGGKIYGLDGPVTVWRQESNDPDVTIEISDGDHVYAYFGQRRGGSNYYALDITNRNSPKLMWQINGGTGDFSEMGQSWSKAILGKVRLDCDGTCTESNERDVLFFGGGYDDVHDETTTATSGDAGAAIYMVDATTGELLWSAGDKSVNADFDLDLKIANSIPGDLTVIDVNGDKLSDVVFAVDILGKIWRIDFNNRNQTDERPFAQGGLIADLSDDSQLRRFYNGADVSVGQTESTPPFFVISVGTGYMAKPRDTSISDRFYVLFEHNVFNMPRDKDGNLAYTTIDNDDLLDLNAASEPPSPISSGYYKDAIDSGEKFLRMPLTTSKITFYTSYIPHTANSDVTTQCGVGYLGSGRLYAINFITGESVLVDGYLNLKHPGIPPEAVVLNISDGTKTKKVVCIGTECFSEDDSIFKEGAFGTDYPHKTFWRENQE